MSALFYTKKDVKRNFNAVYIIRYSLHKAQLVYTYIDVTRLENIMKPVEGLSIFF